jgi:hypothetical protein
MAKDQDPQIVSKMPAFPGVDAARDPLQFPPGARSMMGIPVGTRVDIPVPTIKSGTQAGGKKREARK